MRKNTKRKFSCVNCTQISAIKSPRCKYPWKPLRKKPQARWRRGSSPGAERAQAPSQGSPRKSQHSPWAASSHTASAGWPRWSPELSEAPWTEDLGTEHTAAFSAQLHHSDHSGTFSCRFLSLPNSLTPCSSWNLLGGSTQKLSPDSSVQQKSSSITDCQMWKISLTEVLNTILFWKTGEALHLFLLIMK